MSDMYDIWLYSSQDWWRKCQISCYRKYRKFHFLPCVRQSGQNSKDQGSNPGWISKSFFSPSFNSAHGKDMSRCYTVSHAACVEHYFGLHRTTHISYTGRQNQCVLGYLTSTVLSWPSTHGCSQLRCQKEGAWLHGGGA